MEGDVMKHYAVLLNIVQFVFLCKHDCEIRRTTILCGYGCGRPTEKIQEKVVGIFWIPKRTIVSIHALS